MNKPLFPPLLAILLIPLLARALGTSPRGGEEDARADAARFQAEVLESLDQVSRELDVLDGYVAIAGPEQKPRLRNDLADLQIQRNKLHQDLQRLENAGGQVLENQYRTLMRRLYDLKLDVETAHLNASPTPEAFLEAATRRLTELGQDLVALDEQTRSRTSPAGLARRQTVLGLIRQHEAVSVQVERLRAAQADAFTAGRAAVTTSLSEVAARVDEALKEKEVTGLTPERTKQQAAL
jgi:hypothetical protein